MQLFFMHVGSFVAVIVYFTLAGRAEYSPAGVRTALVVALGIETAYIWLARRAGELKQFDAGLWALFAAGTVATSAGFRPVASLFEQLLTALVAQGHGDEDTSAIARTIRALSALES